MKQPSMLILGLLSLAVSAVAQEPAPQERVAAVKQSLQESQERLRQYEWIESTTVSLKGDVKSQKQERCYYGADGKLQKVPLGTPKQAKTPGGLRGRAAKKKKEELSDYMEQAVNVIKLYMPPDAARLQQAKDAGKASIHMVEPGRRARLEFGDYLQAGDRFALTVDLTNNRLLEAQVSTYLGTPEDPVSLTVRFGTLVDGATIYPEHITLEAKAKQVTVVNEKSGYRKLGT